jgi:DNA-binding MarR family transcriptional regulator
VSGWNRGAWEHAIVTGGLPAATRHTALTLATFANRDGEAWPGERSLALHVGMSRSAVWRHLGALLDAGFICRAGVPLVRPVRYRLTIPGREQ